MHPDKEFNKKVHGEAYDSDLVLEGKTATFMEFLPLYRRIGVHAAQGLA